MNTLLLDDERLDDLGNGYSIIQKNDSYRFTSDSVLLANYVVASGKSKVVDLCSGSGIVGVLVAIKNSVSSMTLLELQPSLAEMSKRTVELNGIKNVDVLTADVKTASEILGKEVFDVVCSNPPYYRVGEGKMSDQWDIAVCRHELELNLQQLVKSAADLLKFGGKFYVVYRSDRLAELICALTDNKLEPKDITLVLPAPKKEVDTVLVCAKKGAEKGVRVRTFLRSDVEADYGILKRK